MRKCHLSFVLLIIISLFMSVVAVSAQDIGVDDQGNPNDPTVNERANACYTDPRFEGQCDTPIEWFCGYTIIRYDYGLLDTDAVELTPCADYLPPEMLPIIIDTPVEFAFPTAGCVYNSDFYGNYSDFMGGNYLPSSTFVYSDNACSLVTTRVWNFPVVYAPEGPVAAEQLCIANGNSGLRRSNGDVYECLP